MRTEVGVIPEGWNVGAVGEICIKVQDGTHFSPSLGGDDYLYITSKNIGYGTLDVSGADRIDAAQHEAIYKRCDVRKGDLLLTKDGANTGNAALNDLEEEFSLLSSVAFLRFDTRRHAPGYYLQQVLSCDGQKRIKQMMAGNAITRLTLEKIRELPFPIPPLSEQRAIAAALSDVDALISSLDKLIAKKRDIKQAAMQQLLTGRRRLPGFSGRWEERRLEDVAALDSENLGGDTPRDYEFNYVSLEDVNRGILRGYANQLFSSAPSRARRVIRSGDVLVSTVRPNLGSHLLFKSSSPDWICSTGFSVVRCVEDAACPGYVFYHLFGDYVTRQIDAQLTGSSYPAISSKDVGNLRMPFPSIDEQRAIASVLSDMDAEIEALERRRDKTWLLKQGMMQELLTGRVRLV